MKKSLFGLFLLVAVLFVATGAFAQTATPFTTSIPNTGASLITLQGQVPAGNALSFTITTPPTLGTVSLFNSANGTFVYTPTIIVEATDTLQFTVTATPLAGGAGTVSAAATVSINVTGAKTTVRHRFLRPDGTPRTGKVIFALTAIGQSGQGLEFVGGPVVVNLNDGWGQASLTPNETLFPQAFYGVYLRDSVTGTQENYGLYSVKPAPSGTISPLGSATVVDVGRDANLKARLTVASQSSVEGLINLVRSFNVLSNGTTVAARPSLNFIAGSGLTQTVTDNAGANRVDVTLNCPSCPGANAALGTGTPGQLAFYSSANAVGSAGWGGANRLVGFNNANNALEYKQILGSGAVTVTHGIGTITVGLSGGTFTLNGLTPTSQSFAIANSGCTQPAWTSSSSTHYLCQPIAGPGVTYGLMSAGAQEFSGKKTFNSGVKMPGQTIELYDVFNTTLVGELGPSYVRHTQGIFGSDSGTATSFNNAGLYVMDSRTDASTQNVLSTLNLTVSNGALDRAHHVQLGNVAGSATITGQLSGSQIVNSFSGTATASAVQGVRGEARNLNSGAVTKLSGVSGQASAFGGSVSNAIGLLAKTAAKSSATITNAIGVYAENQTQGTNNYAIFTDQASAGVAGAVSSFGGGVELRGAGTIDQAGIAPADAARLVYDIDTNKIMVSSDGSNYKNLAGYGERATQTVSGNVSANLALASVYDYTLSGAITSVTATNLAAGNVYQFIWRQPAGANYGLTESGTVFRFTGGTNPSITAANGAVDLWTCTSDGSRLYCTVTYDVK